jgi:hypothetical protein
VDSQLWSEVDVTHALATDLSATAIVTTRLGNALPNPTLAAAGIQIDYRHGSWTVSGTGYYVCVRNTETGARTRVWLPAAASAYKVDLGPLVISDRNRVEQLEGIPGSPARYRNRASAYWHLEDRHALAEFFISNELFYDFSRGRWSRNRTQAGLQFDLGTDTKLQVFYMRQNNTYGTPDRLTILGLTLQLELQT